MRLLQGYLLCRRKVKSIKVKPWRPIGCEILRVPHCLNNGLAYGGKVVSSTHWPRSTPKKHYSFASGTRSCQRLSEPAGPSAA
jgi:hypothetical protein